MNNSAKNVISVQRVMTTFLQLWKN